jgi:hypothetical protein
VEQRDLLIIGGVRALWEKYEEKLVADRATYSENSKMQCRREDDKRTLTKTSIFLYIP